jgi:selenide,water dikinase
MYPALIVGLESPDDAAVYRLNADQAVISTVDFFPPVVDDPYQFGAIAAANALSDIYAMGGEPLFAVNLVAYPDGYGYEILTEILRGGAEKVREAGAVIAGGHTVTDREPKYGLAVTGLIHPDRIRTKGGAQVGDQLILTKPLGIGTITTALKRGVADPAHVEAAVASMLRLNRTASHLASAYHVHAMTDITGYGLIGHAHELAHHSHVRLALDYAALRWVDGAQVYGQQEIFAGGLGRNREYYEAWVTLEANLASYQADLLYDPQTSGGLLIALPSADAPRLLDQLLASGEAAALIGSVLPGDGEIIIR